MTEWTDPRYTEVVKALRETDVPDDAPPRGFVVTAPDED